MGHQARLNLCGVNIHATGDDSECPAIGQVEVALFIEIADVSKSRPVVMKRVVSRAGLGLVTVIFEDGRKVRKVQDAGLERRQFVAFLVADVWHAHDREADGSRVREPILCVDEREPDPFRRGVVLVDNGPQPVDDLALDVDGAGAAACTTHFKLLTSYLSLMA
jgi:hypothetical protein